jgi:hypothetical protein
MKRLDFIGIGVQKAATTWVFRCLLEHPNIRGARVENDKELNFFNHNYDKGSSWYHSKFEFGPWKTGEFSVLYFNDKNVPKRIYQYNPKIKLLLCLRNPIDRAFSHHLHEIKEGHIPQHLYKFSEAVKYNPTYLEMGKYATHLERYLEFFEPKQIHIILFDDIQSKPDEVLKNLFNFLEIDDQFTPSSINKKIYAAHTYISRGLDYFLNTASGFISKIFGEMVLNLVKMTKLPSRIRNYNKVEFDKQIVPNLTEDERKMLYTIFSEEIESLSNLINRDLSIWKL